MAKAASSRHSRQDLAGIHLAFPAKDLQEMTSLKTAWMTDEGFALAMTGYLHKFKPILWNISDLARL